MTQPLTVPPPSVPADGSLKVLWIPGMSGLANPATPTLDELTDQTVVDLSCYFTGDGWAPSTDEQVSTDDRLCSRQTFERPGRFTEQLEVTYVYRGQEMESDTNLAFTVLRYREEGFLVTRWGIDFEEPIKQGDVVDVIPCECGRQRKQPPEANNRLRVTQKMFITGLLQQDVPVIGS